MTNSTSENYRQILREIEQLVRLSDRAFQRIKLVAVSKFQPLEKILQAFHAGCHDFGENRVQEALEKIQTFQEPINWHLIGSLQKNKVNKVIGKFHLIHSVDSLELAQKLSQASLTQDCQTDVLLQINTSGEQSKQGMSTDECQSWIESFLQLEGIRIHGLMTMAPFSDNEKLVRSCFAALRELKDRINQHYQLQWQELSMGMSHDFAWAIEEGATIVRIGSKIFGERA